MLKRKRIDEKIKHMEHSLAELKKEKSDLRKEYLKILYEEIKAKETDIERLKKRRSDVA